MRQAFLPVDVRLISMEFKNLTPSTQIPVLGLGTWEIGGRQEPDSSCDAQEINAIGQAIEMGYTHIDTAEAYGGGHTEELVGKAITGYKREDLFIATKVSKQHLHYDDLLNAAQNSLQRLGTDYLDLYMIHHYNPDIPISETMPALDYLIEKKLIRHIGVSNFNVAELKAAQACAKNKIVANQIEYSLQVREKGMFNTAMGSKIIPYCQQHNIMVVVWRPLNKGMLARPGIRLVDELAQKYEKTPAQIALNWLITQPNVAIIAKSANKEHLKDNLGACGWQLDKKDLHQLDNMEIN